MAALFAVQFERLVIRLLSYGVNNMLEQKITFTHYDPVGNTCKAKTTNGEEFNIDPFVGCAIPLTDEEYENGEGSKVVGRTYIMTQYSVYSHNVVPHEGGLVAL